MSEYVVNMPPDMPYDLKVELNAWYVASEPIVRCRDCKWLLADEMYGDSCRLWCRGLERRDGFCAWGERRER